MWRAKDRTEIAKQSGSRERLFLFQPPVTCHKKHTWLLAKYMKAINIGKRPDAEIDEPNKLRILQETATARSPPYKISSVFFLDKGIPMLARRQGAG
jgi:hypothetical protein